MLGSGVAIIGGVPVCQQHGRYIHRTQKKYVSFMYDLVWVYEYFSVGMYNVVFV